MLTRKVVIQVIVFVVVGVLAVAYTAMRYAGIGSSILTPGYNVRLELNNSGGIFTNSEVTYRGVTVGKVTGMRLTHDGLEVDMHIDSSAPRIPADLRAAVADRSAVGEQYVDLMPNTDSGPYLAADSVIPASRTSTPLPTQNLLTNLDNLASSVPTQSLRTVVDELDKGFNNTGPDLGKLLDSVSSFTKTAQAQLPQTTQLLDSSGTVLNTQTAESGAIQSFSGSLERLSGTLKSSDGDIRRLIQDAPQAATQVTDLLNETGPGLGSLLANLLTTANILVTRQSGLQLAMVAYPQLSAASGTVLPGDGTAHLGLVLNAFNPPPCTQGYQGTPKRAGNETSAATLNTQAYCATSPSSGTDVRGSNAAPYGGNPGPVAAGGGTAQQGSSGGQTSSGGQSQSGGQASLAGPGLSPTSMAALMGLQ